MKQKVGPAVIVTALALVAAFAYFMYRISFAPRQDPVSANNRPDYVKQMQASNQAGQGNQAGSANPAGATGQSRPGYGQGSAYQAGGQMGQGSSNSPLSPRGGPARTGP